MIPVWLVVRAGLRSRWRAWLVLAVVAGLTGGLVMAVAAGARRTDAAYPALAAWSRPPDDIISTVPGLPQTYANVTEAAVRRLPQVSQAAELDTFTALSPASISVFAPTQGIPDSMWRRKLLAGSLPAPGNPDEADISFPAAQSLHLGVGGTLRTVLLGTSGQHVPVDFRVTGIDAAPGEFPPQYGTGIWLVWATPAFARQFGERLLDLPAVALRLRHGAADVPALERAISRMAGGKAVSDYPLGTQAANTEHSIRLQGVALWLLSGLLTLLGLLILGQLLSRFTVLESADFGVLRSFGMGPAQLTATGLVRAALIGAAGAVLALVVAVAASPVFPVGMAAIAEPRPGVNADWLVLGLGMAGVPAAVTCCAAWPAWRAATAARRPAARPAPRAGVPALVRGIRPVPAATGIRLSLHRGSGRTAVPVASTITASVVGVVGLSVALVFSASLGSLLGTPRLYGVNWDAMVSQLQFATSLQLAQRAVAADPQVAAWTGSYEPVPLAVNGVGVGGVTTGPGPDGALAAVPISGGPPSGTGQIVLGQRTLLAAHARVGDTVRVSFEGLPGHVAMRVVGTAIFPALGDTTQLGTGAELTVGGLLGLVPRGVQVPPFTAIMVRFRPGVSGQEGISALSARVDGLGAFGVTGPSTPADLVNFGQLQSMPLLIGLSLGLLALLTIAHLLVTLVRRRRRDLAVLRALGFTGRQVRATVSWMAVTLCVVALAIGVPAGLLCGRLVWGFFTGQLGALPVVCVPVLSFALLVAAALALAVTIALVPGIIASRARPAEALRAE
jgi:ABC-type lipoprotein release transport system permease subunit